MKKPEPTDFAFLAGTGSADISFVGASRSLFFANATAAEPLTTAAGIALGNTLEAVLAAELLRRAGVRRDLGRMRDVLALTGYAAAGSPLTA